MGNASESNEDVEYSIINGYRVLRWLFYWAVFVAVVSLLTGQFGVMLVALAFAAPHLVGRQLRGADRDGSGDGDAAGATASASGGGEADGAGYSFW